MRTYSDAELAAYLGEQGIPLDAYFLVGEPGADLPALYLPEIGFRYIVIEINDLACECKAFLARRGVRRFRDSMEWQAVAHVELWPGWERHAPVAPAWAADAEPGAAPDTGRM